MVLWCDLPTLLCRFSSVNYTDISITLLATSTLRNGAGMALGPVLGGLIWTQTGDYTGVRVLSFGASLAGVLSILVMPSTSCCLLPRWEEQLPPEARSGELRY